MDYRKAYKISRALELSGGIVACISAAMGSVAGIVVGFVLMFLGTVIALLFCRCPQCKAVLAVGKIHSIRRMKCCHQCGAELDWQSPFD